VRAVKSTAEFASTAASRDRTRGNAGSHQQTARGTIGDVYMAAPFATSGGHPSGTLRWKPFRPAVLITTSGPAPLL